MKKIFTLILILPTGFSLAQTKPLFGTYVFQKWGCCFSVNCADKYILTLKKDSSYILEHCQYESPLRGKWWKYTLVKYERENYYKWDIKNDTLTLAHDEIYRGEIIVRDNKLFQGGDVRIGKEWLESHGLKMRIFKKERLAFLKSKKIKKHIRYRS